MCGKDMLLEISSGHPEWFPQIERYMVAASSSHNIIFVFKYNLKVFLRDYYNMDNYLMKPINWFISI